MEINIVKDLGDFYLVIYNNGNKSDVPKINPTNRDYRKVQEWLSIEGNNALPKYTLLELKDVRIVEIKAEAGKRITEIYPEWKQRNHMAAVADIHNKELIALKANTVYTPSEDEVATITAAQTAKNQVFTIRARSNELEASLDSMTQTQLEAFDPTNDSNWI